MNADFDDVADDFFVNMTVQTTLPLSNGRETVLHFYEAIQKQFPDMTVFYQRENGDFVLEADRDSGSYQWVELQSRQLTAGYFSPPDLASAYRLHRWLLERSVYYLGISPLDVEALDVLFGYNLDFQGNRDAVVAQALLNGSPLAALTYEPGAKAIEFEPSLVVTMDEDCSLQTRLSLETRSSSYQVRTGQYDDEPISIYFTVRRYPPRGNLIDLAESFAQQCSVCEELVNRLIVPNVIQPIAAAIATSQ